MEKNIQRPVKPFIISRKKPIITYVFIGLCTLLFIADFLIKIYIAAKYNIEIIDLIKFYGMKNNELIIQGQLWRIVTAIFLHGDIVHIGFNMYALYIWGRYIETLYGRGRYVAIFMMAGILSIVASFAFTPANSLGASGAIYGLFGALLYFRKYDKALFNKIFGAQLLIFLGISLFLGFSMAYVDNIAHIAGIIGGYISARAVGLLTQVYHGKRNSIIFYAVYTIILIGLFLVGFLK